MQLNQGDLVTLNVPENRRLHGRPAVVEELTDYGAVVACPAAATGRFRALSSEMEPVAAPKRPAARDQGYSGDICGQCQGCRLRRNGACLLCEDCGSTSGCS